jgi:hypothetical protein
MKSFMISFKDKEEAIIAQGEKLWLDEGWICIANDYDIVAMFVASEVSFITPIDLESL